ncbi:MAG TPA: hypothetical protein VMR73_00750 [Candidatus Paceibacterota bacterium]|nr:hypothetical protein [Candidatus Paceibacterota bacterium]
MKKPKKMSPEEEFIRLLNRVDWKKFWEKVDAETRPEIEAYRLARAATYRRMVREPRILFSSVPGVA